MPARWRHSRPRAAMDVSDGDGYSHCGCRWKYAAVNDSPARTSLLPASRPWMVLPDGQRVTLRRRRTHTHSPHTRHHRVCPDGSGSRANCNAARCKGGASRSAALSLRFATASQRQATAVRGTLLLAGRKQGCGENRSPATPAMAGKANQALRCKLSRRRGPGLRGETGRRDSPGLLSHVLGERSV